MIYKNKFKFSYEFIIWASKGRNKTFNYNEMFKVDNEEISDYAYLKYILYKYNAGDTIDVTYIRNGKIKTTKLELTKNID